MYYLGDKVDLNHTTAIKFYIAYVDYLNSNPSISIYHDDEMVYFKIAFMYYSGQGVEQDYQKAFEWIIKGSKISGMQRLLIWLFMSTILKTLLTKHSVFVTT